MQPSTYHLESAPASRSGSRAKPSVGVLALGLALTLTVSACSNAPSDAVDSADDGELTTVTVALVPSTPWLPAMVAADQGFFEEHGLNVEITKVQQSPIAAIGQQFDIGQATGTDFTQGVNGGLELILVSNIAQEGTNTTALMVPSDSNASSVLDLEGKRIGVASSASAIAQSLKFLVADAGGDPNSLTLQEMPFPTMPDQLASGQVDAIAPVAPFSGQAAASGARALLNPILEAGQRVLGDDASVPVLFAASTTEWAEANPDVVDAWRAALTEAAEYIVANEADARRILQEFTELPAEVANATPLFSHDTGAVKPDEIGAWIEILKGAGTVDTKLAPADLVLP